MDFIIIEVVVILLIICGVLLYYLKSNNTAQPIVKKTEIIERYTQELNAILIKFEHNNDKKIKEKTKFIKKCSSELSRNIFFTEEEANDVIRKLASL